MNDVLLQGPDLLTKSLIGVLLRFRQKNKFGFVGDIKEMFNRVNITNDESWSQCFLWRDNPDQKLKMYRMRAMIFGANSSPFIAQFVKNENANICNHEYPDAARAIRDQHYVDDYLDSTSNIEDAIKLIHDVIYVHSKGGFEIRNFISNSKEILDSIPQNLRAETNCLNLTDDIQQVLGLLWKTEEDTFVFTTNYSKIKKDILSGDKIPTKREALKLIMATYDPWDL